MIIGIESSCDESALALFDPELGMRAEWIHSQIARHQEYGGIVPDLASREHLDHFPRLLDELLKVHVPEKIDILAVTTGPGLAGCLALGMALSQSLSVAYDLTILGVNHLRGHAFSPFIARHGEHPATFVEDFQKQLPHLGLIVSGGNTVLFEINEDRKIRILANTVDDAAGEALDKGAKLLGMPYPGGPLIEKEAAGGNPEAYAFPRSFPSPSEHRFSFSGLKTSLRYLLEKLNDKELEAAMADICASYQEAVVAALVRKSGQFLESGNWRSIGLSGGVANNLRLRTAFSELGNTSGLPVYIAEPQHTGDNAGMIAFAAFIDPEGCRMFPDTFEPSWELA
jgi:N6-L-threonylcarbamoyladenine synthase